MGLQSGHAATPEKKIGYLIQGDVAMVFDDGSALIIRAGIVPHLTRHVHNARNIGTVETLLFSTYFIDDTKPLVTTY